MNFKKNFITLCLAIVMCFGLVSVTNAGLNDGLVVRYEFEGNINDSSGNNYNGRMMKGGIIYENGIIGQAGKFDGNTCFAIDNTYFPLGNGTISAWVKVDHLNGGNQVIITSETNYVTDFYFTWDNYFKIGVVDVTPSIGEWVLYTLTYENGGTSNGIRKAYINGVLSGVNYNYANNAIYNRFSPIDGSTVGGHFDGGWNFYGSMDDLRMYNRPLSATEVQQLYELKNQSQNIKPVANPGESQSVNVGSLVTLSGVNSYDPDKNYPLSYVWTMISKPVNSEASLAGTNATSPTFVADVSGTYIAQLVVIDSLGLASNVEQVEISTVNTLPVADAGVDQLAVSIGGIVQLNGLNSYDEEGSTLTYSWNITQKPEGSTAILSDPVSPTPTFVPDVYGEYVVELVVSDGLDYSEADSILVTFSNVAPIANAGLGQSVLKGQTVYLNGGGSSDANQNILTYSWSMVSKPEGSLVEIINANSAQPNFVADLAGEYIVSLVVNDGFVDSEPSNVVIMAITYQDATTNVLQSAQDEINLAIPTEFKNSNQQNALTNKINSVLEKIDQGLYQEALDKLRDDIIKKTDGCPLVGQPDNNDWIKDCETQIEVYNFVLNAINLLEQLI